MNDQERYFRVSARIEMALEEGTGGRAFAAVRAPAVSEAARASLGRLSNRRDAEVKEALSLVLDALASVERELDVLQRRTHLQHKGIVLGSRQVRIGGDGLWIPERLELEQDATLHLSLRVQDATHLLAFGVHAEALDGGTELTFLRPDMRARDLVVAFVFEHQRQERRRERSSVPHP